MTDDILAAIDRAVGCHYCGGELGESPSDDFCSEGCQRCWWEPVEPMFLGKVPGGSIWSHVAGSVAADVASAVEGIERLRAELESLRRSLPDVR